MNNNVPTTEELASEARAALQKVPPKTGHELFVELIRKGLINARWQVTKLIGGSADPEPNYQTWTDNTNSSVRKRETRK